MAGNQNPTQRRTFAVDSSEPAPQVSERNSDEFVSVGVVAVLLLEEDIMFSTGYCWKFLL